MQPRDVVIVSACRTAIGKIQGQFKDVSARELAITAGKEAIRRAGIDINTIDEIVMGECYTAMQGSLPARQVSMRIGLPIESSAVTVNQNCASVMRALEIACNNIQLGKTDIGLVVGVENMTQAPFLLPKARMGYRMGGIPTEGGAELYDSMIHDALYDALVPGHMGVTAVQRLPSGVRRAGRHQPQPRLRRHRRRQVQGRDHPRHPPQQEEGRHRHRHR